MLSTLEANYCIQVLTTNLSEKSAVIGEARGSEFNQYQDVRVESRGRYLVFRVGDYKRYSDARRDVNAIKSFRRDAYVRKCDFIKSKALYIKNESQPEDNSFLSQRVATPQTVAPVRVRRREVPQKVSKPVQKRVSSKKEELKYDTTKYSDSLWGDCKKCFVPVYEEESEGAYADEAPQMTHTQKSVQKKRAKTKKDDTFWSNEIVVEESQPKVYKKKSKKKKVKNKFNIDEQFLP